MVTKLPIPDALSKKGSDLSAGSDPISDGKHFCYLATKQANLQMYAMSFTETHLNILSAKRDKLKSAIELLTMHAKQIPKVPREPSTDE